MTLILIIKDEMSNKSVNIIGLKKWKQNKRVLND